MSDKAPAAYQTAWFWVLGLIGLDYFSTLAYQPSLAFEAAGRAAPVATVVVVLITFFGALPVYAYVAARSPHGQGSLVMFERLLPGWRGKTVVLVLLGFAAADFVFTKTLSVADAAEHLIQNPAPDWQRALDAMAAFGTALRDRLPDGVPQGFLDRWNKRVVVALVLLNLGFAFWAVFRRGYTRRVIQLAVVVVGVYLLLNAVVVGSGLYYLLTHPGLVRDWYANVTQGRWLLPDPPVSGTGWSTLLLVCLLVFPKLSLGLSGFELSMVAMPLLRGSPGDQPDQPHGRVRRLKKLLLTAATIMAAYLLGATLITTILIPPEALAPGGAAANRALAYLAHGGVLAGGERASAVNPWFGQAFGTLYDASTVTILSLAGASVTLGLRRLVPQYLERFGMELERARAVGAIFHLFNLINLCVTLIFHASVYAQRGAYATSVLILLTSTAVASGLDLWRSRHGTWLVRLPWSFLLITGVFTFTAGAVLIARPDGITIAFWFILAVLASSVISRLIRSTELRFQGFQFKDESSRFLWESLVYLEFPILVPHRPGRRAVADKEREIRERHRLTPDIPVVFLEANIGDASEFFHQPVVEVIQEEGRFIIRITRCASVAHVIAAAALELSGPGKPPEVHFGWSDESPVAANLNFVLFGQGNVPWLVHELIRRAEPRPDRRPRVVIG